MKVKANIRAGRGVNSNSKSGLSTDSSSDSSTPVVYVPPVSRCVGI